MSEAMTVEQYAEVMTNAMQAMKEAEARDDEQSYDTNYHVVNSVVDLAGKDGVFEAVMELVNNNYRSTP